MAVAPPITALGPGNSKSGAGGIFDMLAPLLGLPPPSMLGGMFGSGGDTGAAGAAAQGVDLASVINAAANKNSPDQQTQDQQRKQALQDSIMGPQNGSGTPVTSEPQQSAPAALPSLS